MRTGKSELAHRVLNLPDRKTKTNHNTIDPVVRTNNNPPIITPLGILTANQPVH